MPSQVETPQMQPRSAQRLDEQARCVLVSINPQAGSRSRRSHVEDIEGCLASAGYTVRVTSDLDELTSQAEQWRREGRLRAVLACGGDGTASLLRNHLPLEVPLLPLPLGTENLLSRYLGQSAAPTAVRHTIEQGVVVGLDLGRIGNRYFLMMISVGFDAEVVRRLHKNRRGHINRASYVIHAVQAFRGYAYPELRLYCGAEGSDRAEPRHCRWLFGFNLPLYACGWQVAPAADGTDGLLDVCTFQHGSWHSVFRYLCHVTRGSHLDLADVELIRCERFRVESPDGAEVAYQLDGDFAGLLPVDVELLPGQSRLLVLPAVAERLGFVLPGQVASSS